MAASRACARLSGSRAKMRDELAAIVRNASATAASSGADLNGGAAADACARLRQRLTDFAALHIASLEPGLFYKFRASADIVIDTTGLSPHDLRREVEVVGGDQDSCAGVRSSQSGRMATARSSHSGSRRS